MRLTLFIVAAVLLASVSTEGRAALKVCNETGTRASVAIGYKAPEGPWTSEGWWIIEPGACKTVVGGDLPNRYYYWHATNRSGSLGGEGYMFCTSSEVFTISGDENCAGRGYDTSNFSQLDVGEALDYTISLTSEAARPAVEGDAPPGTYGEPYTRVAEFLGCWAVQEELQCEFTADGWTYIAYDTGPTHPDIIDDLGNFSAGSVLMIEGDMISYEGGIARITIRDFDIAADDAPGPSPHTGSGFDAAAILDHMQGTWDSDGDSAYSWIVNGPQLDEIYDGNLMRRSFFEIAPTCAASDGQGPVIIAYPDPDEGEGPSCYLVGALGPRSLQVLDVLEGVILNLSYANESARP